MITVASGACMILPSRDRAQNRVARYVLAFRVASECDSSRRIRTKGQLRIPRMFDIHGYVFDSIFYERSVTTPAVEIKSTTFRVDFRIARNSPGRCPGSKGKHNSQDILFLIIAADRKSNMSSFSSSFCVLFIYVPFSALYLFLLYVCLCPCTSYLHLQIRYI